jgi:hypothetical protein
VVTFRRPVRGGFRVIDRLSHAGHIFLVAIHITDRRELRVGVVRCEISTHYEES